MEPEKIAAFYADPARAAYHAHSAHKAFFLRSLTVEPGFAWEARRWARFLGRAAVGMLREMLGSGPQANTVGRAKRSLAAIDAAGTAPSAFARPTAQR
jgi:hypothetical protein